MQSSTLNSERKLALTPKSLVFLDALKNPVHRAAVDKFRPGKTHKDLRICCLCQLNEVDNESHVMLSCTFYNKLRSKFFNEVIEKRNSFKDLDNNSRILFLLNSIYPFICRSVAGFIFHIMNHRYKMLFQS